jgi:8-oxo-dGTP pyrophosphatase MutT (NUDIX family)
VSNATLKKHRNMIRHFVQPASRLITRHASSTSATATAVNATLDDQRQVLHSFPANVQHTITVLQDHFNGGVNPDDRLFELYDSDATEKMWNATTMTMKNSGVIVPTGRTPEERKQAGVLVLLVPYEKELSIVFTRRSKHLSSHASQISFPGGHYEEATDGTIVDTAVREAVEELHSDRDEITERQFRQNLYIFGCTTAVPSLRGTPVTPVLGIYNISRHNNNEPIAQIWPGNPSEVELVFTVPVTTLIEKQRPTSTVDNTLFDRTSSSNHKLSFPQYPTSNGTIWGLTAYILQPIIKKMLIPLAENKQ